MSAHKANDQCNELTKCYPDIDTIAATILFSYFRSSSPPQGAFSKHYVPLIQTGRSSLSQIMHLPSLLKNLHHSGLSLSDLVVLDDMSLDGKQSHLSAENTHLFLINWNLLVGRQGENFSKNIAGVIDRHNKDEDYVPKDTKPEPRIIGGAGSATALAVNAIRESNGEKGWNKELAQLGLAGILVPTKNLKHHATKEDESAYEFLAGLYGKDFDRSGFYHSIVGEERREPEPTPKPVAVPVPVVPVTTREPVVSSGTVNQATPSGIEPIHGTRTATEAAPEDIYSGGSHRTFTANRLVSFLVVRHGSRANINRIQPVTRPSSPSMRRIYIRKETNCQVHQDMDLLPQLALLD